ncbi:MAG TPA: MFS transporter, partial [Actinomycetes bacterium]|nr:MFS transporter [Actinomycetes bacterium]
SAAVRHVAPGGDVARAHVLNEARDSASALIGPSLGGVLFGISRVAPFVGDAASYLLSAAAVAVIRTPLQESQDPEPNTKASERYLRSDLVDGLRFMWAQVLLRRTLLCAAGFNFAYSGLTLLVILLAQSGGASPAATGLLVSVVAIGGLTGSLVSPLINRYTAPRHLIPAVGWVGAVVVPFFAVTTDPIILAVLLGATTILGPAANAELFALQVEATPENLQGRVFSAALFLGSCAAPLGPLVAGLLFEHANSWVTAAVFAFVMLTVAVVLTITMHRGRAQPALRE